MIDYVVRYTVWGLQYETVVRTSSSNAAIFWVEQVFPSATNVTVVGS